MFARLAGLAVVTVAAALIALQPDGPGRAEETLVRAGTPAATDAGPRFTRVRLDTGVELQVAEHGPADGRPVLLLHGYGDSWFSYSPILDRLPPALRAIVPTQRGHGDSERPDCCYRMEDFAADAVALLDELDVERASVVGHSMGSFVAQRVAIDYPERVDRLVLIGSGPSGDLPPVRELAVAVETLPDPVPRDFRVEFESSTAHEPLPEAFLDGVVEEAGKLPARLWREVLRGILAFDATDELHRIAAPTLVVWGEHDGLLSRAEQDALLQRIPLSRLVTYPDMAHAPNWEQPERFARDLSAFLEEGRVTGWGPGGGEGTPGEHTDNERDHAARESSHPRRGGGIPILPGLGSWHRPVTTRSAEAQRYFDQGLRLAYAFDHDEAARSFERAVELDPQCALCHWGIAYAVGPNINAPMESAAELRAVAAIAAASELAGGATPAERAWIEAAALRFAEPVGEARVERDGAYAAAMREVAARFPDDVDAQVLFADALLNLRPWDQWTRDGRPRPGTPELVDALERALALEARHPGACHLYVHAVEASSTPERALPCAERLPALMPGAGHVVHMPAHVYLRVGRYADAARANIAALEADRRYFAHHEHAPGIYPLFYAPHNLHFLWAAYLLSGQRERALGAARALVERVSPTDARAMAALQGFLPSVALTHLRFREWDAVLAEPSPPAGLEYARGMWHYGRGVAYAERGNIRSARVELERVRAVGSAIGDEVIIILNPAPRLLELAAEVLAGRIATREERFADAIDHFRAAVRMEDALTYDEPPPWYHSSRNQLGEALLAAGRPAEAEAAFLDDLSFVRENGWSLSGLERALRAQGMKGDAEAVARRLEAAWRDADVPVQGRGR